MTDRHNKATFKLSRRAQAVMEIAVFGAIFIFVVGSIFQQGYATALYQQSVLQPLREALARSYSATNNGPPNLSKTYKYNSVSVYIVQDRISPGAAKYGAVDRAPIVMSGSGSLSKGLFYGIDLADVNNDRNNALSVMVATVNGQTFELTSSAFYNLHVSGSGSSLTLTRNNPSGDSCLWENITGLNPKATERYRREGGRAYAFLASGNIGWAPSAAEPDWMYDYNRNGDTGDDFLNIYKADRVNNAVWRWMHKDDIADDLNKEGGGTSSADINGDLNEETIYVDGPPYGVLDNGAGDIGGEPSDKQDDPYDTTGLKSESSIYTVLAEGTVMEMRKGEGFIPGTNTMAMSVSKKRQFDVISRIWQLNPYMAFPERFQVRQNNGDPRGPVEAVCGSGPSKCGYPQTAVWPPRHTGRGTSCCMDRDRVLLTCFDLDTRALYIRSRIKDERGHMWINRVDSAREQQLLGGGP